MNTVEKKTAIILFNLGGPDSPAAIEPFLFNLFNDKAIISLPQPLRWLVAKLISSRRAPVAAEIYAQLGGRSPILEETRAQKTALEEKLNTTVMPAKAGIRTASKMDPRLALRAPENDEKNEYKVFTCMRYWHPRAKKVVRQVKKYNPDNIILLPLYPQFSTTTTGSSFAEWDREARCVGLNALTRKICCYPTQKDFIAAHVNLLRPIYEKAKAHGHPRILFSAHGLPEKIIHKGDPYQWQVEQTVAAIVNSGQWTVDSDFKYQKDASCLSERPRSTVHGPLDYAVCYQSRVGPLKWIGPSTIDEIIRAGKDKVPLVIVPVAFVSEHSETLVELDIEYKKLAKEHGVEHYFRVPTLGVTEEFMDALTGIIKDRLINKNQSGENILCPAVLKNCMSCDEKNRQAQDRG